jgi:AcrR family transcriptional regulator
MSLRERKKYETRLRIQDTAYELTDRVGYANTTVEAIAAAAQVSPSTVYRYFGTKEGIFVWDELELPAEELLRRELAHGNPLDGALTAVTALGEIGFHLPEEEMRRRVRFLYAEPDLQAAMTEAFERFGRTLTDLFVETGTPDPLAARVLSGITMTVVSAAIEGWAFSEPPLSLVEASDRARASLDAVLSR